MKTCSLSEFMQSIDPWLSKDYIHKVCLRAHAQLTLAYSDGGSDTYWIDDCTDSQLNKMLEKLRKRGVEIEFQKEISP